MFIEVDSYLGIEDPVQATKHLADSDSAISIKMGFFEGETDKDSVIDLKSGYLHLFLGK
jgi:hypothetical protein